MKRIKCTAISDTHTYQDDVTLSGGDILIHSGDSTFFGQPDETYKFIDWLVQQPYKHKVFIAGNHELGFEPIGEGKPSNKAGDFIFRGYEFQKGLEEKYKKYAAFRGIHYLRDETVVIKGIRIYGTPYQPDFYNWAFQYKTEEEAEAIFSRIPEDTDILITHGPPYNIRDKVPRHKQGLSYGDFRTGCKVLLKHIYRIKPKYHVFGHIHHSYGVSRGKYTTYINASTCNDDYEPVNKPINFYVRGK